MNSFFFYELMVQKYPYFGLERPHFQKMHVNNNSLVSIIKAGSFNSMDWFGFSAADINIYYISCCKNKCQKRFTNAIVNDDFSLPYCESKLNCY